MPTDTASIGWRSAKVFSFVYLVTLLGMAPVLAQESASTVTGAVMTESGEPVPRASVVLRSAAGRRRPEYGTLTAPDGTFALREIMPDRYSLEVKKDDFVDYEHGRRHARGRGAVLEFPGFGIRLELESVLYTVWKLRWSVKGEDHED